MKFRVYISYRMVYNILRTKEEVKMTDYWDNSPEEEEYEGEYEGTFIIVNGSRLDVSPGASFVQTVKDAALNAGLTKFRTFLNSEEITPSTAPETFNEDDVVELRRYDVAG